MTAGWLLAATPSPLEQPAPPPVHVPELVIGGLFLVLGLRSLVKWMRTGFEVQTIQDHFLFSLHSAARVGLWFAFAGFFLGLALVDEPRSFIKWYVFVPIGLAGIQLLTAVFGSRASGNPSSMRADETRGPLEPEKHGQTSEPGLPQPEAAEVESARLLENDARAELRGAGLTDEEIRRLADEYIALDRGEDVATFIEWAKERARRSPR